MYVGKSTLSLLSELVDLYRLSLQIFRVTLDTPMNRKWMPDADQTAWTPLEFVAE